MQSMYGISPSLQRFFTLPFIVTPTPLFPHGNYSYAFVISRALYKWYQTVSDLWGLAVFTQHKSLEIHQAVECISSSFGLWSPVAWFGCATDSLTTHSGRTLLFSLLAVMNRDDLNIPVQVKHRFSCLWVKCPGEQFWGCTIVTCFILKKLPNGFPEWPSHFTDT